MNLNDATDIKVAGASVCAATQTANQATFWGFGSTTISKVLAGNFDVYKYGGGTVTLTGTNTFLGTVFFFGGTLETTQAAALGNVNGFLTFKGGVFRRNTTSTTTVGIRIKNSTSPIIIDAPVNQTWSNGAIDSSNTAGFTKRGSGNLTLTSANTFSGPLRVEFGNLILQNTNANVTEVRILAGPSIIGTGSQALSSYINTPFGSATLYSELKSAGTIPDYFSLNSATGAITFSNPIVLDITYGRAGITAFGTNGVTISSPITVIGTGNQSQVNTTASATNSTQIQVASIPTNFVVGNYISGAGVPIGTRILQISGLTLVLSNAVTVASGAQIIAGSGDIVAQNSQTSGALFTISSAISAPNMNGNFSLRGGNVGSNGIFTGSLNAPTGGLAFNGVNTWTLFKNASNNYVRLNLQTATGGIVKLGDNDALPAQCVISWSSNAIHQLDLNGKNQTCAGISTNAGQSMNPLVNSGTLSTLTLAGLTTTRSFYGSISGPINLTLNSTGRTQALYGSNGHTGTTTITAGSLFVGSVYSGTTGKLTSATLTPTTISATFGVAPIVTDTFRLFGGSTSNTYASVTLTNGGGLTGYWDAPNSTLQFFSPSGPTGVVTTLAGTAGQFGTADGTGSAARFNYIANCCIAGDGNIYVAESIQGSIRKVTPSGVVTTLLTGRGLLKGICYSSDGNLYVIEGNAVTQVTLAGVATVFAGSVATSGNVNATGTSARFSQPFGVTASSNGTLFVADSGNNAVRQITAGAVVTTYATQSSPNSICCDSSGNLFLGCGDRTVRKIATDLTNTVIAGSVGQIGFTDGTGSSARFTYVTGIGQATNGDLWVSDCDASNLTNASMIRRVTQAGVVTTVCGSNQFGGSTDGTGLAARFYFAGIAGGIAISSTNTIYVCDYGNGTLRKIT